MAKILVVDDEQVLVKGIKFNLEHEGYQVEVGYDGEQAVELAREGGFDLILLDLMMPKIDGLQACMRIREFSDVPIIMLTARSEDTDKIIGFECGADDYITKPFNIGEVIARVKAVLRRTSMHAPRPMAPAQVTIPVPENVVKASYEPDITFKTLRLDRNGKVCYINGKDAELTRIEFDLLHFFLNNRERIHSRAEIMQQVWDTQVANRTIDVNVARLRQKLGVYGDNIVTRLGFGYGFKSEA